MQRRQLTKQPFVGLLERGFLAPVVTDSWPDRDEKGTVVALIGAVDGYAVEVSSNYNLGWGWNKWPYYFIRVFFNTENLSNQALHSRHQQNLIHKNRFPEWSDNYNWYDLAIASMERKILCGHYIQPDGSVIFNIVKRMVVEMKELDLKPVSYDEAKAQWQKIKD